MKKFLCIAIAVLVSPLWGDGRGVAQNPDINLLRKINSDSSILADKSFKIFSKSVMPVTIATPSAILLAGYFNNNQTDIRNGYKAAISILVAGALGSSLKLI